MQALERACTPPEVRNGRETQMEAKGSTVPTPPFSLPILTSGNLSRQQFGSRSGIPGSRSVRHTSAHERYHPS